MKKQKKQKKQNKKHGNGKQIALVVIVVFLIAGITAALLWLSDLGTNWDVKTWGDKFSKQEQVTKPGNNGGNKPIIPIIPEPVIYDAIEVGDEFDALYIDTDYVITDEDIARFKSEGKADSENNPLIKYWLVCEHVEKQSGTSQTIDDYGVYYQEITSDMLMASGIETDEVFTIGGLYYKCYSSDVAFWTNVLSGEISDELWDTLFYGDEKPCGYVFEKLDFFNTLNVQEVYCADILQNFISKTAIGG